MSAPESTAVIPPAPPAAPAPATATQIESLHQRLNEIEGWLADKLHELLHLVEKVAPILQRTAAAAAPVLGAAAAPVVAAVEEVAEIVPCCSDPVSAHTLSGCSGTDCKCNLTAAGARLTRPTA